MSRTEKRSSGAIRAAWLVLLAVGLVASALRAAGAAQATDLTVVLTPKTVGPIAQGAAFRFFVKITNNGNTGAQDTVVERIEPVSGTASPVDFVQDRRLVPAHSTLTLSHDIATPQYFSQIGTFRITPLIAGVAAGAPLEFDVTAPTVLPPAFQDVTAQAGVGDAVLPSPVCDGQSSAGSAWADVDGDGDLDLYLPLPDQASRLYINDGTSQFTDQAAQFGVRNQGSVGRGAVFADYDNDGDPDLYVLNEGDNRLYRNDGGATGFTDVTTTAGVGDPGWSQSGSWGDFDQDGYLDLYVTDYADCAWNYQNDRLYHNNGNGTFTDVTSYLEHGPGCADGCTIGSGFQAAWFDYDSDNDLDLYLANDFNEKGPSPDPNHLWRNDGSDGQGGWTFTDVSAASGTALSNLQSMGIGISDVDGDLDPDLAISDIAGNRVLRNNGNGTFKEVSDLSNADRPYESAGVYTVTWGLAFFDFNLDRWEDLYVASGALLIPGYGSPDPRHNQVFANIGGANKGQFADLSALSGGDSGASSRGVAFADYDRDGLVDMYVVNFNGSPILYRNTTPVAGRHWIELDPVGTVSNRDGCGARVIIKLGTKRFARQAFCGSVSLGSGNDPYIHFGLGSSTVIDEVKVFWPSGRVQVLTNVAADQAMQVVEPA